MKIAICQINPIIGDFDYNTAIMKTAVEQAKGRGCSLAIFPEMSLLGYPPRDLLEKPAFIAENQRRLHQLASQIDGINVVCGYVERNPSAKGKPLLNAVAFMSGGKVIAKGGKKLLPSYDVFDETRYFEPAPDSLLFEMEGQRLGVTICEDIWNVVEIEGLARYDTDPVADLNQRGIDILLSISASPYTLGKRSLRLTLLSNLATDYHVPTLYCNQVGGNDDLLFDGCSMVLDQKGRLVRLGKEFEADFIVWDSKVHYPPITDPWPEQEASILRGLVMGTRDYASKCGFRQALVGLSGGIDSALVAAIAKQALGSQNVTGVSMPSPYTSEMSKEDARELAENLGIHFREIPIDDTFQSYKRSLASAFEGLSEDETEENLQARIRGNLLMALSNKFNALLLSTGNKSEIAMGYCTLYGDMSGGLAVISDIPKTICYRLARFLNKDKQRIPERIFTRPPSAELRPDQTDQDTLPPYEVLDRILEAAVEKNLGHDDIVGLGNDPKIVREVMRRLVFNEYKRRQAPPGLKITSKAFGYGRRYPIARGKEVY